MARNALEEEQYRNILFVMLITKEGGEKEEFSPKKLEESLRRAGAEEVTVKGIIGHVEKGLTEGTKTGDIYQKAFDILKEKEKKPVAARYSLKHAVMDLGPSGFPFEAFLAEVFRARGYSVETDVHLKGKCAEHEVDLVLTGEKTFAIGEAKFHNRPGYKTALKIALYVNARSMDLAETNFDGKRLEGTNAESWLITNTKFTTNAIHYAECVGLKLIGWNYPSEGNLEELIVRTALHPLTCLTTLSRAEKKALFEKGEVLCRAIKEDGKSLKSIGLGDERVRQVLDEAGVLCVPR